MAESKGVSWPRETLSLWSWMRNLLWAALVLELLTGVFASYEILRGVVTFEEADINLLDVAWGLGGALMAILWLIVFALCVVYTCRITYRMMKNLDALEAPGERMAPGWAVGWYFIPFANLYLPMRAVNQIWRGTYELTKEPEPDSGVIGAWWLFWIVSNIASTVSFRMSLDAGGASEFGPTDIGLYTMSLYVGAASSLLGVVSTWFMLKVFGTLARSQNELVRASAFN